MTRPTDSSRAAWRKTHAERVAALWPQSPGARAALEVLVAEVKDLETWLGAAERHAREVADYADMVRRAKATQPEGDSDG